MEVYAAYYSCALCCCGVPTPLQPTAVPMLPSHVTASTAHAGVTADVDPDVRVVELKADAPAYSVRSGKIPPETAPSVAGGHPKAYPCRAEAPVAQLDRALPSEGRGCRCDPRRAY